MIRFRAERSVACVATVEEDSPELESELLVAINGPYTPYSSDEMRAVVERIIREEERK